MRLHLMLIAAFAVAGCGDNAAPVAEGPDAAVSDPDAATTACEVSEPARVLFEELVHKALADVVYTTHETDLGQRGFSSQLVGVTQGNVGHLTLLGECTEPVTYDWYCEMQFAGDELPEDPFYVEHDKCSRLGCEAANIGTATMYWTMRPELDNAVRHRFEYPTTMPAGIAIADPNPLIVWRFDLTTPGVVEVSAGLDQKLTVTPTGEAAIVLDHTGQLRATKVGDELTETTFAAVFPDLVAGGSATLDLALDADGVATGSLIQGNLQLATIAGPFSLENRLATSWCP